MLSHSEAGTGQRGRRPILMARISFQQSPFPEHRAPAILKSQRQVDLGRRTAAELHNGVLQFPAAIAESPSPSLAEVRKHPSRLPPQYAAPGLFRRRQPIDDGSHRAPHAAFAFFILQESPVLSVTYCIQTGAPCQGKPALEAAL
jgi:hypothetical protein